MSISHTPNTDADPAVEAVRTAARTAAGEARALYARLRNVADLAVEVDRQRRRQHDGVRLDEIDELQALLAAIARRAEAAAGGYQLDEAARDRWAIPWRAGHIAGEGRIGDVGKAG